jgi:sortase A
LKKALPIILILIGIILVSVPLLTEQIIKHYNKNIAKEEITMEEIKSNIKINEEKKDIEFDFSVIQDIDIMSAIKGSMDFDRNLVIGILLIPDLDIDIPIFKGLTNGNLMAGVATMRPDQSMGVGNYPLAGHNMRDKSLLFGSLMDIKVGTKAIISDGDTVYEYEIYENIVVPDTALDMIFDEKSKEKGKPIISLMTCYHSSKTGKRFFSLGELVDEYPVE